MSFGLPILLALLLALPVLVLLTVRAQRQRGAAERLYAGAGLALAQVHSRRRDLRLARALLFLAGIALLGLGLARPQFGQRKLVLPKAGSDVILAIDVSRSMAVQDVTPSRLDRAKQSADAIIGHLSGDRVGLVVFAGSASLRFPLTTDQQAAQQVIDSLTILDSGVKSGTDLSSAITTAVSALGAERTRGKVLVIMSDGEDLAGTDVQSVQQAANQGITVHTVGVGTAAGGQVISVNGVNGRTTPIIDPSTGEPALSRRDDNNLRLLAEAGRGSAYDGNATAFAFDLSNSIDRLQRTNFTSGLATIPNELFQIPLAMALVALATELGLMAWQRKRHAPAAVSPETQPVETDSRRRAAG